jgi:hypothetical protein
MANRLSGRPGEKLWTERKNVRDVWDCRLVYHEGHGVEVRISVNNLPVASRRFPSRAEAIEWADVEQTAFGSTFS